MLEHERRSVGRSAPEAGRATVMPRLPTASPSSPSRIGPRSTGTSTSSPPIPSSWKLSSVSIIDRGRPGLSASTSIDASDGLRAAYSARTNARQFGNRFAGSFDRARPTTGRSPYDEEIHQARLRHFWGDTAGGER